MEGRERVSVIHGKKPVIIVCPHGPDDTYTDVLAQSCAESLDGYAVINRGFERSDQVDVLNDKADCNRISHVFDEVVKEEFLDPILKFKKILTRQHDSILVYHLHGFGKQVEAEHKMSIDLILGYGESEKSKSYTCSLWRRDLFIDAYRRLKTTIGDVCVGKGGGKYAARSRDNMNQYFRKYESDNRVESMQIEISPFIRTSESVAKYIGKTLAATIQEVLLASEFEADMEFFGI